MPVCIQFVLGGGVKKYETCLSFCQTQTFNLLLQSLALDGNSSHHTFLYGDLHGALP